MSNSKGPEVLASDPINQDTLKYPHRQEGNFLQSLAQRIRKGVAFPPTSKSRRMFVKTVAVLTGAAAAESLGLSVLPEVTKAENIEEGAEEAILEASAEIRELPQNFDLDLISRRNRQYPIGLTGGRFFTETAGFPLGFAVTNDERFQIWQAVSDIGGIQTTGYPLSNRVDDNDGIRQLFQNGMLYISSKPEDFDSVIFIPNPELPDDPRNLLPQEAFKPIHADAIPLPDFITLKANWNTLDLWKEAAEKAGKPVWQFLWEHQIQHTERFGKPMMIPDIPSNEILLMLNDGPMMKPDKEIWKQWAAEAKMSTVDLGFKIFFGQTPQELLQNITAAINAPLQRDCLEQVNQIRTKYGLPPITKINPYAILAARSQAIHNLFYYDRQFTSVTSNPNAGHLQQPDDLMFTGENMNRRMKRFGAPTDLAAGDIISGIIPTSMALWAWEASLSHRPTLLEQPLPGFPLEVGYAEGRMGPFMQAVLVSASRF